MKYILKLLLFGIALSLGAPSAFAQGSPSAGRSIKRLYAVMKKEPTVREVQEAAAAYYQLEPSRVKVLARNARLKGLVPEVSVNLGNRVGNEFRNTADGLFPTLPTSTLNPRGYKEAHRSSNDSFDWGVNARWALDKLVFSAEALDAKSLTSLSENLIREVTTLYYSRRRVMISLFLSPPEDPEEYLYELMRIDELTSTLDALTGGTFEERAWKWSERDLLKKFR